MRLQTKNGQHYVDQIGLDQPLMFPGTMDKQTVVRAVMSRYGDQVRYHEEKTRLRGNPSPEQALVLGAGQTGEMLGDFMNKPRAHIGPGETDPALLAEYDQRAEDRRMMTRDMQQTDHGGKFSAGGVIPYFATPAGLVTRPVSSLMARLGVESVPGLSRAPEMIGRSVVADAGSQGAIFGAASDDSNATEGAAYGSGGGMLGKALSRALRPADNVLDPYSREVIERGRNLNYVVTPATGTGSRALAKFEDAMENNLLMSGGLDRVREANQENSNRIVREALGFRGPFPNRITPDMLDQVSDRFNKRFGDLTTDQSIKFDDPGLLDALEALEADNTDYIIHNKDFREVIDRTLDLMTKNSGWLSGKDYQILSSKLVKAIRANFKPGGNGNPEFAIQLSQLKDAIDDAAELSIGSAHLDEFRSVRADYKVYANLMKNSVINEDTSNVSLQQLGNVLRREDRFGYRRGNDSSDLYDATRFVRSTQGDGVNSLTSRRQSLPQMVMASTLAGAAAGGSEQDPASAALGAAAIPASLLMMGKYYNSPMGRRHFGKGLIPPISDSYRRQLGQKIGMAATGGVSEGLLPSLP